MIRDSPPAALLTASLLLTAAGAVVRQPGAGVAEQRGLTGPLIPPARRAPEPASNSLRP
jgi:hypothetical protein